MLRTLCSGLRSLRIAAATAATGPLAPPPSLATVGRSLCSDNSGGKGGPPAHWDRSGGSGVDSALVESPRAEPPPPAGVALGTHMLLNEPTYNVLGDVVPVNEYHLTEEVPPGSGCQYHTLPIVYMGARRNNTIVTLTDSQGRPLAITSTGVEGFLNAKKSTTVAAQVVGVSIALKAKKLGLGQVRVVIRGMNQLRMACLKGMCSAGLQIVSITDNTKIHYGKGRRPRKPPRK